VADETILQNHASRPVFLIGRLHDKNEVDATGTFAKIGETN